MKNKSPISGPPDAQRVLAATQQRAAALQGELVMLARLVRGYCLSIGLDPDKAYDFSEDDKGSYATARDVARVKSKA